MPGRRQFAYRFKPIAQLGDAVLLADAANFVAGPGGGHLFEVTAIEAIPLLGPHGAVTVWTQSGAAVATFPFLQDSGAASGNIGAGGGSVTTQVINSLKNQVDEVSQLRFLFKAFGTLPASWAVEDMDLQMSQPGSTRRWSLMNATGVLNQIAQAQLPADAGVLPAQGVNATLPAAYMGALPFEVAHMSEVFVYRDNGPVVTVVNNGSVSMNSAMGVALMISGFKFKLRAFQNQTLRKVEMLGSDLQVPAWITNEELRWRVPILPIAGRG